MAPKELQLEGYSGVEWEGKVVVFGGMRRDLKTLIKSVYLINISTGEGGIREVETKGETPTEQAYHTADVYKGEMYIVQGLVKVVTSEQRYCLPVLNLSTMEWRLTSTTGQVPPSRCYHASSVVQGKLFVFGGYPLGDTQITSKIHMLDLETLIWTASDVPNFSPLWGLSMVPWVTDASAYVIVFGGINGSEQSSNKLYFYNVTTGEGRVISYEDISDRVEVMEAMHTFTPKPSTDKRNEQIPIAQGDIISVLSGKDIQHKMKGWYRGFVRPEEKGWFPANYARTIPAAKIVPGDTLPRSKLLEMKDLNKRYQIKETGEVVVIESRSGSETPFGYKPIPHSEYTTAEKAYKPSELTVPYPRALHSAASFSSGLFIWSGEQASTQLGDCWTLNLTGGGEWSHIPDLHGAPTPMSSVPAVHLPGKDAIVLPVLSECTCYVFYPKENRWEVSRLLPNLLTYDDVKSVMRADSTPPVRPERTPLHTPRERDSLISSVSQKLSPLPPNQSEWHSPLRSRPPNVCRHYPGSYHTGGGNEKPLASPRDAYDQKITNLDLPRSPYSEKTPDLHFHQQNGRAFIDSPRDWIPQNDAVGELTPLRTQPPSEATATPPSASLPGTSPPLLIEKSSSVSQAKEVSLTPSSATITQKEERQVEQPSMAVPDVSLVGSATSLSQPKEKVLQQRTQSIHIPAAWNSEPALDSPREWVPSNSTTPLKNNNTNDDDGKDDELLVHKKIGEILGMTWRGNILIEVVRGAPASVCGGEKFVGRRVTHVAGVPVEGICSIRAATEDMRNVRFRFDSRQLTDTELVEHLIRSLDIEKERDVRTKSPKKIMNVSPPRRASPRPRSASRSVSRSRSRSVPHSHHQFHTCSSLRKRASWDSGAALPVAPPYQSPLRARPSPHVTGLKHMNTPSPARKKKKSPKKKRSSRSRQRSGSVIHSANFERC
eukprot:TRINITY_DN492_c3_g1_i1.p1 TRINITY_DN492_c3_g1~~TRINITY_DN492_c3_g1_i1.p1  ORF type:complete len:942 (+),score=82.09 TRINITY_DN492_c3_g1_i1:29-2854(+)